MRTRRRARVSSLLLLLSALTPLALRPASAQPPTPDAARAEAVWVDGEPQLEARLLLHPDELEQRELRVGVLLEPAPGWHVYARDPGELGLPTRLRWSARPGAVEELPWPPPRVFENPELGLSSRGYSGPVLLPARARFSNDAAAGARRVRVEVDLAACADECVPATFSLERRVVALGGGSAADRARARALFAEIETAAPAPSSEWSRDWLHVLLLAFAGGLLLNGMPCVLPVLAIKALALAELRRHGRRAALAQALAHSVGVLVSFWLLAGCVLALRAAGTAVGWGFQFQEPRYVAALGCLLVLLASNLFGVFEFGGGGGRLAGLGSGATGARRSFFDGLLTVALATPCTAPFLGTAVGVALASPPLGIVALFSTIGLGLALPLALATALPGVAARLPRPGPWMSELRVVLGFALLATAIWLVWVTGRASGVDAVTALLCLLLAVAVGAWLYGALQRRGRSPRPSLALLASVVGLALAVDVLQVEPESPARASFLHAAPYDRQQIAAALRDGRPAFVYFTADWCITCKVNERLVLRDPRVRSALQESRFAVFAADYTLRDERITSELARFGRSGVPLYLLFAPGAPDAPRLLPELLSVRGLLAALDQAARAHVVSPVTRPAPSASMEERSPQRAAAARRPPRRAG